MYNSTPKRPLTKQAVWAYQRGLSLVELMVGVTIGMFVVAIAIAGLMVMRGTTGTVSESTTLQQQAAYAFRVIGAQLRQAGSIELNLNLLNTPPSPALSVTEALSEVSFDPENLFNRANDTVSGTEIPSPQLTVGYQNTREYLFGSGGLTPGTPLRDCIGNTAASTTPVVASAFALVGGELRCGADPASSQPVIDNVVDFQVRYLVQSDARTISPSVQRLTASSVNNWSQVFAVEVCLDLQGVEFVDSAGANYSNCSGVAAPLNNRLHQVFRNVFHLRSQGAPA